MIELEKTSDNWRDWNVLFKGKSYNLADYGSKWSDKSYQFPANQDLKLTIADFSGYNFNDFHPELYFGIDNENGILGKQISTIYLCTSSDVDSKYFGYCWDIKLDDWDGHFNPFIIRNEIAKAIETQTEFPISGKLGLSDDDGFASIYFDVNIDEVDCFKDFYLKLASFLDRTFEEVEEKLSIGGFSNKVVAKFSFDEEVQQSCISYLNYFIEFLKDLGIKSKPQVNYSGQDMLFSITPDSKEESLVLVSQALSLYLKLPQIDTADLINEYSDPLTELKLERLKSEIDKLKGDLRTSAALIRYQDKLLSNGTVKLKEPIEALQSIHIDGEEKNKKEFLSGGIKLGVFKKAGIEFDWNALLGHFKSK